jgi:hypothetical protein
MKDHSWRRALLCAAALLVAAGMVADTCTGAHTGVVHLAPALLMAIPLVLGRYVGEAQLVGLAGRARTPRRRRPVRLAAPRSYARVMKRGGRLVASGLAKRPPPRPALARIAS